jgi:hypothetical protein
MPAQASERFHVDSRVFHGRSRGYLIRTIQIGASELQVAKWEAPAAILHMFLIPGKSDTNENHAKCDRNHGGELE